MRLHAVWQCQSLGSTEHFGLSETENGYLLRGVSTLSLEDVPVEIRYQVDVDRSWRTRAVKIDISSPGGTRTTEIEVEDGVWTVDGKIAGDLNGCVDVDLGWTPATNTLPIRRIGLDIGETAMTQAAWLRFPELTWERAEQTYTRLDESLWRYQSGTADHEISVTPDGLVCRYGDVFWGWVEKAG